MLSGNEKEQKPCCKRLSREPSRFRFRFHVQFTVLQTLLALLHHVNPWLFEKLLSAQNSSAGVSPKENLVLPVDNVTVANSPDNSEHSDDENLIVVEAFELARDTDHENYAE